MKGYKDENGWWHHPKPNMPDEPLECPTCGSTDIDAGLWPDNEEHDSHLEEVWEKAGKPIPSFMCSHTWFTWECERCDAYGTEGDAFYGKASVDVDDPPEGFYVHGKPMTPDEARRAEYDDMLRREREAGQLPLPLP